ncbi:MAG: response regulator [Bacteroidetes bacterium]|nr:response regulator [Bacteroidota bacterium]
MTNEKRIMVVDDNPDHLLICTIVFQKKGYRVKGLPGCKEEGELLEAVERFRPDLVFVDHNMPGLCGADLVKLLKRTPSSANIPVVYFTSEADIESLAKEAGADGYCRKPFEIADLLATVERYAA